MPPLGELPLCGSPGSGFATDFVLNCVLLQKVLAVYPKSQNHQLAYYSKVHEESILQIKRNLKNQ